MEAVAEVSEKEWSENLSILLTQALKNEAARFVET
jgi:hypothetical protein